MITSLLLYIILVHITIISPKRLEYLPDLGPFKNRIFTQMHNGEIGEASYHFIGLNDSYINYELVKDRYQWVSDDDNFVFPDRMYFRDVKVGCGNLSSDASCTFSGIIDFSENGQNLNFQVNNATKWKMDFKIYKNCSLAGFSYRVVLD